MKYTQKVPMHVFFNRVIDRLKKTNINKCVFNDGSVLLFNKDLDYLTFISTTTGVVHFTFELDYYIVKWDDMADFGEFMSMVYSF